MGLRYFSNLLVICHFTTLSTSPFEPPGEEDGVEEREKRSLEGVLEGGRVHR